MSTSEDAALEDLNILLSDLRVTFNNEEQGLTVVDFTSDGVQPTGHQFRAFSDSCQEVVDQIGALERALLLSAAGRSDVGIGSTGGAVTIVENAVLRGMPSPPVSEHDTAAVRWVKEHSVRLYFCRRPLCAFQYIWAVRLVVCSTEVEEQG